VFLLGPEVNEGRQSTVCSTRKTTAADCTHPDVSLTDGVDYRWLLHEGEWLRPFGSAQQRMRRTGGGARRRTEAR
jgi:hypothetical protein